MNTANPYAMADRYQSEQDAIEQMRNERDREMQEIREEVEKLFPEHASDFGNVFRLHGDVFGVLYSEEAQDAYAEFTEKLIDILVRRKYADRFMSGEAA